MPCLLRARRAREGARARPGRTCSRTAPQRREPQLRSGPAGPERDPVEAILAALERWDRLASHERHAHARGGPVLRLRERRPGACLSSRTASRPAAAATSTGAADVLQRGTFDAIDGHALGRSVPRVTERERRHDRPDTRRHARRTATGPAELHAIAGGGMAVTLDDKGKMMLPPAPAPTDIAGLCSWLTVVFALDPAHPITSGERQGRAGPEGHVELRRAGAASIRFEPMSKIIQPHRLVSELAGRLIPTDGAVPAFKGDHCRGDRSRGPDALRDLRKARAPPTRPPRSSAPSSAGRSPSND